MWPIVSQIDEVVCVIDRDLLALFVEIRLVELLVFYSGFFEIHWK